MATVCDFDFSAEVIMAGGPVAEKKLAPSRGAYCRGMVG